MCDRNQKCPRHLWIEPDKRINGATQSAIEVMGSLKLLSGVCHKAFLDKIDRMELVFINCNSSPRQKIAQDFE